MDSQADRGVRENMHLFCCRALALALLLLLVLPTPLLATSGDEAAATNEGAALVFLWTAIILLVARLASLIERVGQPPVLGELLAGIVLGNLTLLGIHVFEPLQANEIIAFLAELGVVILLFQIGLESNVQAMQRVGGRAFGVAIIGVVIPFAAGTYLVGPLFLPDQSFNTHLFLGASLTATSVGITARVFRDLGRLQSPEARIVLGAAVIDDVLGLIILAVVSAIVSTGAVNLLDIIVITLKGIVFLIGAILVGQAIAPPLGSAFSKLHTGTGMKFTLVISFCLIFAYLAQLVGLAPIVGAFAAGLVLDPVHFRTFADPTVVAEVKATIRDAEPALKRRLLNIIEYHADRHVEDIIEPLGYFLVPLFFVMTGMAVNLETLFDASVVLVALIITVVAFVGKLVSGVAAGDVNRWIVGWGMAPRGEVGLIFAAIGSSLGVVTGEIFSIIVVMVILTTLLSPPILALLLRRAEPATTAEPVPREVPGSIHNSKGRVQ